MAIPSSASLDQLRQMSDDELQTYFEEHARYMQDSPPNRGYSYAVRAGTSKALYSDCTADLREQFFAFVRGRKPKLTHQWHQNKCIHCEREMPRRVDGMPDERTYNSTCRHRMTEWEQKRVA